MPRHQQLLMAVTLLQLLTSTCACYFNIGQSARSLEDLAEAAPILLSGRVLSTTAEGGTGARRYAAAIRVLEVLKGRQLISAAGRDNSSAVRRVVEVDGFGDPVACLSEVHPGDWLILFLSVAYDSGATGSRPLSPAAPQAHYSSASSATAQLTPGNLARVSRALGWQPWSNWTACNSSCGSLGVSERVRTCAGPPCDYGDSRQVRRCNRWPCEAMRAATPRLSLGGSLGNNSASSITATFALAKNFSEDAALALTLHSLAAVQLQVSVTSGAVGTLMLLRSPDVAGGLLTLTARVPTAPSAEAVAWSRQIDNQSISIYLTVKNGSLMFAVGCWLTGRVPLPSGISSASLETVALTPAVELMNSAIVPWSAATDCAEEQLMLPPPTYWTAWSPCSSTCGEGTRTRQAACRLELARCQLEPSLPHADTGQCPSLPLCNPDLTAPGSHRGCRCLNGGFCFQSRCLCPTTFAGDRCEIPLETEADAAAVAVTQPPRPLLPQMPLNPPPRRRNDCRPRRRRPRCRNGGVCDTASGSCRCPMGWTGASCQTAQCRPRCRNGGSCVQPNLCDCPEGYSGTQCQVVDCYPPCVNGGTCLRPGKCACQPGYRGKFCHRVHCYGGLCLNGGRCLEIDGLCRCPAGFYGPRCERRNCAPELSYRKTYRPVVKRLLRPSVQPCSPGAKSFCLVNSVKRVVAFKIVLRPYFTCPPA